MSIALIVTGVCLVVAGVLWQVGLWPGSQPSLPAPVALATPPPTLPAQAPPTLPVQQPTLQPVPTATTPPPPPTPTVAPTQTPAPLPVLVPTLAPAPVVAADAEDRKSREPARATGYAVRLAIPSISLDTTVVQGGIVEDSQGRSIWQTLPFVAVHYGDLTSLIGAQGNAVISGHVVTIDEGNVFRSLYRVGIDDEVQVWDQDDREYDYHVVDVQLVTPSDVSVMAPTPDETLTLITCGGSFDRVHREFSERLIVTAKPLPPAAD